MPRSWLLPLLAFALALALRAVGIGFFLPHQSDPDDHAIDQLQRLRGVAGAPEYSWGKYGHLVARTLWLLPEPRTDAPLDEAHLDEHLSLASADHLRARWISALLGALVAPATFWLARRWLTPGWSLVAAAFAATSLLHPSFSQQARPHVPCATLSLLAVLAALRLRRKPTPRSAGLLALALFLAAGTLHTAAFLLPAWLAALGLRERPSPRLGWQPVVLPLLATGAALAAFWPFLLQAAPTLEVAGQTASGAFPHLVDAAMFDGGGFVVWLAALRGYDPLLLGAAVLGALAALVHLARWRAAAPGARRDAAVALAFALPCGLAFGLFRNSFERFFLPLYPYLAVLAALGLRDVAALVERVRPAWRGFAGPTLACVALALPAYAAGRLAWLRSRPDTFELAAAALRERDPSQAQPLLLHPRAFLPVAGQLDPATVGEAFPSAWMRHLARQAQRGSAPAGRPLVVFPAELQEHVRRFPRDGDAAALLVAVPTLGCTFALDILPDADSSPGSLNDALRSCADLVWQVPGGTSGVFAENGYQQADMLHVVLQAEVWGPRLGLWKFR